MSLHYSPKRTSRIWLKVSFLEEAPVVRVSSRTGEGIPELRQILAQLARQVQERPIHGLLRLPVDRIFTLKGHGTVVTGTLISGSIAIGDEVEILPGGTRNSVRGLESHNRREDRVFPASEWRQILGVLSNLTFRGEK